MISVAGSPNTEPNSSQEVQYDALVPQEMQNKILNKYIPRFVVTFCSELVDFKWERIFDLKQIMPDQKPTMAQWEMLRQVLKIMNQSNYPMPFKIDKNVHDDQPHLNASFMHESKDGAIYGVNVFWDIMDQFPTRLTLAKKEIGSDNIVMDFMLFPDQVSQENLTMGIVDDFLNTEDGIKEITQPSSNQMCVRRAGADHETISETYEYMGSFWEYYHFGGSGYDKDKRTYHVYGHNHTSVPTEQ